MLTETLAKEKLTDSTPLRPDIPRTISELEPRDGLTRQQKVASAVDIWKGQLVDLGGRNTLLYYRDLKQGTLDLGDPAVANQATVGQLLDSRTVRLSYLFGQADELARAAKRARTIQAKAREMFEERGLQTLFLAWGMATWTNPRSGALPAAPILLRLAHLIPRGGAAEDFDLALTGEFEVNPTFLHFLKTEHDLAFDADELVDLLGESEMGPPDPTPLFDRLTKSCETMPGFAITPRVVLGNFSYAKLPMVRDLENATEELLAHDLIAGIAGDEEARTALRARHTEVTDDAPDHTPLADEFLVLDADASQNYAINAVLKGADLVIEGPPGTGKSQTISNLIATLIARGKRVLFVAEKRAAIDAVTKRLNDAELGDLILDLHDGAGNRRKLAEDLARTMHLAASLPAPDLSAYPMLEKRRATLVDHARAMHIPREPWSLNLYEAQARLLGIPPTSRSQFRLRGEALAALDQTTLDAVRAALDDFVALRGTTMLADPYSSPWAHALVEATLPTPDLTEDVAATVGRLARSTIPSSLRALNAAADSVGTEPAASIADWGDTLNMWDEVRQIRAECDENVFALPLEQLTAELRPASGGAFRRGWASLTDRPYRRVKRAMHQHRLSKGSAQDAVRTAAAALSVQTRWKANSDPSRVPASPTTLAALTPQLGQAITEIQHLQLLSATGDLLRLRTGELLELTEAMLADRDTLNRIPQLTELRAKLEHAQVAELVQEIGARHLSREQALLSLDHVWLSSIQEAVEATDPAVATFDGELHSRTVSDYRFGDRRHIEKTAARVRRACAERSVAIRDDFPQEAALVQTQAKLKRKHLPIRQLFEGAPHVLTSLKPCWAMSPLVVSQLLPAQRGLFDVVIFDEASQITPADAVGTLMRADRAVVAGDPHQLPPTAFFLASQAEEEGDDEIADSSMPLTKNLESVLDVMGALLPPPNGSRTLEWHYRSRDERLIAFSNAQRSLYDWSLTTFPGVAGEECLQHVLVPFAPGTAGQEESASAEVQRVTELIIAHAEERPQKPWA